MFYNYEDDESRQRIHQIKLDKHSLEGPLVHDLVFRDLELSLLASELHLGFLSYPLHLCTHMYVLGLLKFETWSESRLPVSTDTIGEHNHTQ